MCKRFGVSWSGGQWEVEGAVRVGSSQQVLTPAARHVTLDSHLSPLRSNTSGAMRNLLTVKLWVSLNAALPISQDGQYEMFRYPCQ